MSQSFFVSGIGTEVGKTVVSSILVEALQAAYWKPVQCGDLDNTDSDKIANWTSIQPEDLYPERHRLLAPMSPHAAADREKVSINLRDFQVPNTSKNLIIEGAGGLEVPLNQEHTILDLIEQLQIPVILVSRHYLGSINHTLLSIRTLQQRNIPIAALIFNGAENKESASIIQTLGQIDNIIYTPELKVINSSTIQEAASNITLPI